MHTEAETENPIAAPTVATMPVDKGDAVTPGEAAPEVGQAKPGDKVQARIDSTLNGAEGIVFYDGVCGLCNKYTQFMLTRDKKQLFRFAAQQGDTFAQVSEIFPDMGDLSTVIVAERLKPSPAGGGQDWRNGWRYSRYSTAALRATSRLGGIWALVIGFIIVPPFIRNIVYKFVASNRYKWFGKSDTCRLPTPEERAMFLP